MAGRLLCKYIFVPDAVSDEGAMSPLGEDGVAYEGDWLCVVRAG
jgi:hypothetical protein